VFGEGGRRLDHEPSGFRAIDVPNDYPSITKAMSSLLAELSREIVSTLQRLRHRLHVVSLPLDPHHIPNTWRLRCQVPEVERA
jgi:hypothetical protein